MPSVKLTAKSVDSLKPQENQVDYFDLTPVIEGTGGRLVLRVSPKGRKSWCLVYRIDGKQRRYTFKKAYPTLSLKQARTEAAKKLIDILDGNDPAAEVRRRRQAMTVKELANEYLERHARVKKAPASVYNDDRMIRTYLKPWHNRKAEDIKRRDVIRLLDSIADRAPVAANRLKALISKMYNFGIRRDEVEHNPATNIDPPGKETARDRVYSDDEIKALWSAFKAVREGLRGVLELILLTGQRPGEVCGMQWDEIDGGVWSLPAERTKNRRPHVVPLSGQARAIIDGLTGDEHFIFPANRNSTHTSINSADIRKVREKSGVADFRAHDLRRTALTNMGKLGVTRFIQDRIANHADSSMGGVYDRHEYFEEKARALNRWADRLDQIRTGKKATVVKLGRAAK